MIAHGMSNRQFDIYQKARALQYLLEVVPKEIELMRCHLCESIEKIADEESGGDKEIKRSIEQSYLNAFNIDIPDNMEKSFLQSMCVQIYAFAETTLKDMVLNKTLAGVNPGGGLTKLERYYLVVQSENSMVLPDMKSLWPDWSNFKEMRKDIVHDGNTSQKLTIEYLSSTIDSVESLLNTVETEIQKSQSAVK